MRSWASLVLAAVMGGGVTAAVLIAAGLVDSGGDTRVVEAPVSGKGAPMLASAAGALSAAEIYRRRAPGVVFVRAQTVETEQSPFDVFGTTRGAESTGSGFVLDDKGLILTNAHVVEGATGDRGHVLRPPHGPGAHRSARIPTPTSRCCGSSPTGSTSTRSSSAAPRASRSATRRSRSATRSGSSRRSPPAWCRRSSAA